jgi:myo-inositol catabolism protein IolH
MAVNIEHEDQELGQLEGLQFAARTLLDAHSKLGSGGASEARPRPVHAPRTPLTELPGLVADLGYEYVELSPREDFTPFFLHARANDDVVRRFRGALDAAGVRIATHLPLYRWSGPDEDDRQAAVRYWKRAIQLTVELGCDVMNSEFNGRPEAAARSEGQFWRSMEELLPVFEREGVQLRLEPHPDDFVEDGKAAST